MMTSPDFIDSVLGIGSDLGNEVFSRAFDDFSKRHFGTNGMEYSGFKFVYMLYSAILTLPLTQKLGQHKIDALMVVKKSLDLNLAISYATDDGSLSLKIIRFDGSFAPIKSTIEKSVIYDMREILASVKGRTLDDLELVRALTEFHDVTFQRKTDQAHVDVIPEISRIPYKVGHVLSRNNNFAKLIRIQESEFARSATVFVEQLRSKNYDVVKYSIHALTRLLITQHHIQTEAVKLQTALRNMYYLFLVGALEMNWAHSHRLNVHPIFGLHAKVIHGLVIDHTPDERIWKPNPVRSIVQVLTRARQRSNEFYVQEMYENIVKWLPNSDSKLIVVGIEHQKLIDALTKRMDISSFQKMTSTHLLELNPHENIVDLLLKPFNAHDHSNILRINYCIEKLNQMGKHSVHTYLYDPEVSPEGEWLLVPSIYPEQILISLEKRPEQFEPLTSYDVLHFILNSIESQFLKFQDKMSYQDIMTLISGIFSDWEKLSYHGSLGILKADGTPLFVTSMPTNAADP
uniref:Uncharacterized protein n=1 Tax=Romanomermis culicivorax TaxID=13658 RepID=A0A915KV32_ROMCU